MTPLRLLLLLLSITSVRAAAQCILPARPDELCGLAATAVRGDVRLFEPGDDGGGPFRIDVSEVNGASLPGVSAGALIVVDYAPGLRSNQVSPVRGRENFFLLSDAEHAVFGSRVDDGRFDLNRKQTLEVGAAMVFAVDEDLEACAAIAADTLEPQSYPGRGQCKTKWATARRAEHQRAWCCSFSCCAADIHDWP